MIFQKLITSFFYQIIYMSIIATVIGLLILFVRKVTNRKISPKCNYIIWLVFVLALICPVSIPNKISIYNYINIENIKEMNKENSNPMVGLVSQNFNNKDEKEKMLEVRTKIMDNSSKIHKNYLKFIIPDIWFLICLFNLSRVIFMYILLNKVTATSQTENERILGILERCKKKLKITRNIKIVQQDIIRMPSTMGVFHVRIFLGSEILDLDDQSIEDIFLHELSHYKRKDNFMNALLIIAKYFYWINPMIGKLFEEMKQDMELATDEMAIGEMDENEKFYYCRVIVNAATMASSKIHAVLELANDTQVLEQRIDMVLLKKEFDKNSRKIATMTSAIVLLMWLIFYPTSYGMFGVPKLYLELEDGKVIEVTRLEEEDKLENVETVKIGKDESIKLLTEGRRCEDYVAFTRINLSDMSRYTGMLDIESDRIEYSIKEKCIYKFVLKYGKDKSVDYGVKIIVE